MRCACAVSSPNTNSNMDVNRMRLIIKRKDTIKNYLLAEIRLFCLYFCTAYLKNKDL